MRAATPKYRIQPFLKKCLSLQIPHASLPKLLLNEPTFRTPATFLYFPKKQLDPALASGSKMFMEVKKTSHPYSLAGLSLSPVLPL